MVILSTEIRKARKNHKCNFCGCVIEKGTEYHATGIVGDGHVYTWKSHFRCDELCNKLKMYDHCDEGVTENDFAEYVNDEYFTIIEGLEDQPKRSFQERLEIVFNKHLKS